MNRIGSCYEIGSSSNASSFLQRAPGLSTTSTILLGANPSLLTPEAKAMAACKSHKEAERRRRKRINGHLATLRTLLPNLIKTDKATLLGEVVRHVRELKKTTSVLTSPTVTASSTSKGDVSSGGGKEESILPGDTDEVRLCQCDQDTSIVIATLCCEDRPELMSDLTRALSSVKAKLVRAEMATVGGRTKSILWVRGVSGGGAREGGGFMTLSRALKVVVDKPNSSFCSGMGRSLLGDKRRRLCH
ncbi:hypothetical protein Ancab_026233 [Ancistrocladus abbreviatus]